MNFLKKNLKLNNKGFSLVEVIIAMTVLALVAVPLLRYFSDSLRYSAQMAVKQKGTALAQQTIEKLKLQEKLLTADLVGKAEDDTITIADTTYSVVSNTIDVANQTGTISLKVDSSDYDMTLDITVDTAANEVERAVVYGINDKRDVMLVEKEELEEALIQFMAINTAYVVDNGVVDEDGNPAFLSEDEIQDLINREIKVDIDFVDPYFHVRGWYEYTATGIKGDVEDPATGDPVPEKVLYVTSDILNAVTKDLDSIYILFDRIVKSSGDAAEDDVLIVTKTAAATNKIGTMGKKPTFALICQNLPTDNSNQDYELKMTLPTDFSVINYANNLSESALNSNVKIRSNILYGENKGKIKNGAVEIKAFPLSDQKKSVRLIELELAVYKGNHSASDVPYATITTTKGE